MLIVVTNIFLKISGNPHPMVHFWFGFFLAALVQAFLKFYIRLIWKCVWNSSSSQHQEVVDIRQFSGILLFTPNLALSFVFTWIISWWIFGNDHGFWIFRTYLILFCILAIKWHDQKSMINPSTISGI